MKIGVLGAGQLGRMLALAGIPLGYEFRFFDPVSNSPASSLGNHIEAEFTDLACVDNFITGLDVVTYEFENVPTQTVEAISKLCLVYPPLEALRISQDRLLEKNLFTELGHSTPMFANVETLSDLQNAAADFGYPCVLKTRRLGYDGKGQFLISLPDQLITAWEELQTGLPLILESFVKFDRELSIISVRSTGGETAFYPLFWNTHKGGILRTSISPAPKVSAELQTKAIEIARTILERLDYVGVLAVELFDVGGVLLINEMAPRVHNSGHGTIEGTVCSQFENHVRSISGMPLGSTTSTSLTAMINLIGDIPESAPLMAIPGAHLHLYGKSARPGRKVGHITICSESAAELDREVAVVRSLIA